MITSVYLSNEEIVVISGKASKKHINIRFFSTMSMPEGAIINGVITNYEGVKLTLLQMRRRKMLPRKNVRLVIDSSAVMMKCIDVPILPHKKLMGFVKNTFADIVHAHGELLYDYSVISPRNKNGQGSTILCSAAEKETVGGFIDLFRETGVKLKSIDIALSNTIKLVNYYPKLTGQTYILSVLDAGFMSSFLFVNGKYSYCSRSRLLAERGTSASAGEISKMISSLIQFNKSQKNQFDIDGVYFCHLRCTEQTLCNELSSLVNVPCMPLFSSRQIRCKRRIVKRGIVINNYPFAIGNLIVK